MSKSIFITGTSTDVGKTYVSANIMKYLINNGYKACYYKPVLSGAEVKNNSLYAGDVEYVKDESGIKEDSCNMVSFLYTNAVSPHLASQMENNLFRMEKVIEDYRMLSKKYEYIVIEGAGGIMCPFNHDGSILTVDIIKALNTNAILVAPLSLGAINHTLLSVYYMEHENIKINGIIFNKYVPSLIHDNNIEFIKNYTKINILSIIGEDAKNINIDISKIFMV